jgi:cyclopropane fatty-acyl-phospholipid synthase-like methyltransferase
VKPFSEASERNQDPILQVLKQWFTKEGQVLEIGAGTGQHAVYFAKHLLHLNWLPTDREANLPGIRLWIEEAALSNLRAPVRLDVRDAQWPASDVDYVYSANTAHIMSWPEVELMFAGVGRALRPKGVLCLYGPVNRNGEFTSESNRAFDAALRAQDPNMGLRDDRALVALGKSCGLVFVGDHSMPAKNRLLVWSRG